MRCGGAADCADVLFRGGDYYGPAVVPLLTGSLCFPSSLFFPLLISTTVECAAALLEEGKRRSSEYRQLDGRLAVPRIVFAPVGAGVVRESNTVRRAEAGSVHVRTPA